LQLAGAATLDQVGHPRGGLFSEDRLKVGNSICRSELLRGFGDVEQDLGDLPQVAVRILRGDLQFFQRLTRSFRWAGEPEIHCPQRSAGHTALKTNVPEHPRHGRSLLERHACGPRDRRDILHGVSQRFERDVA